MTGALKIGINTAVDLKDLFFSSLYHWMTAHPCLCSHGFQDFLDLFIITTLVSVMYSLYTWIKCLKLILKNCLFICE